MQKISLGLVDVEVQHEGDKVTGVRVMLGDLDVTQHLTKKQNPGLEDLGEIIETAAQPWYLAIGSNQGVWGTARTQESAIKQMKKNARRTPKIEYSMYLCYGIQPYVTNMGYIHSSYEPLEVK